MPILWIALGLFWVCLAVHALRCTLWSPKLPTAAELPLAEPPDVSVIVAARDEAARLEQTVRGLLAQQGVRLQLVVVDDRSRDATPEILARLAAEHPQVCLVRVDELPPGWLGKCHACQRGAERATGEWLLFTDGDIHMQPDLVRRAVAMARREGVQHLTLAPGLNCTGVLTRGCVLAFGQLLALSAPMAEINRDKGTRGVGIGAFNLVQASAYRTLGGHEPLKMEVCDDLRLGLLVRRAGFRQRFYSGAGDLEAEWAATPWQVVRLLEKNWFAAVGYHTGFGLFVVATNLSFWWASVLAPVIDPVWGWAALGGLCSTIIPAAFGARLAGWPLYTAPFAVPGFMVFGVAGAHSMWKTLRQGGVRWRDTFYPLAELRAGFVRVR